MKTTVYVIQCRYLENPGQCGWEDQMEYGLADYPSLSKARKAARADLKEYRLAERSHEHRLITRKVDDGMVNVWGVYEGLHGYLPTYGAWFKTKGEAIGEALALKDGWLEMAWDDPYSEIKVTGDIREDLEYDVCKVNLSWDAEHPDPKYKDTDIEGHNKWVSWQRIWIEPVSITREEWVDYQDY